jgi:hypothetical protein
MLRVIFVLAGSSMAFAQMSSSDLHAKLGPPLQREVFHLPQGFDLTADYSLGAQVCKLKVPSLMPSSGTAKSTEAMRQEMYAFLADLVPASMRGAEGRRFVTMSGLVSFHVTEYENVTVAEIRTSGAGSRDDTITVTFKQQRCAD